MRGDVVGRSLYAGALVGVTGLFAWVSGQPFIFPSLGPSAYLLATVRDGESITARRVVGGHLVGVLAGLLAHHALASGLVITAEAVTLATGHLRLAAAGVVSVSLTTGGMISTDTMHAPACATTLIVSLGILSSAVEGGIILASVLLLFGVHTLVATDRSLGGR